MGITFSDPDADTDVDITSWASVTRASGFDTFATTPSSANLRALVTDETGSGALVFANGALGTPSSATLTNATGLPVSTGISGLGTGIAAILALPATGILDNLAGVRFVATYAALTALTTDTGLSDNSIYCTYGRTDEEDGGFGFWRYDSGSSTTANGGTVLAIDGGGTGRFFRIFEGDVCLEWFSGSDAAGTAQASLTDRRTFVQAALDYCYTNGRVLTMTRGKRVYAVSKAPGGNYCLLDQGVSFIGSGAPDSDFGSQIVPLTGVTSSDDIVYRHPAAGSIDRVIWRNIRINPSYSGSALGKRSLYAYYDASGARSLYATFDACRFDAGNDYALVLVNVDLTNPTGVPFSATIQDCYLSDGLWVEGCADSTMIDHNTIRRGGNRHAIYYDAVDGGSGIPQKAHIHRNNLDGPIKIVKGYGVTLLDNDQEVSYGTNDAAIDIDAGVEDTTIIGHAFGVFGTGSLTAAVKNAGTRTHLGMFRIDTAPTGGGFTAPTYGIRNESGATMTIVDLNGSYLRDGRFTTRISDANTDIGIKYINTSLNLGDWQVIQKGAVGYSVTGTTTETALATITVQGGQMGANGMVRVRTLWTITNSANNKSLRVRIGGISGTAILGAIVTTQASITDERVFHNRNSESSQVASNIGNIGIGGWGQTTSAVTTATVNTASDFDIAITGELANTGETIRLEAYSVELSYGS